MKILYIAPVYYPHIGGLEYVVKSVAERLAKRGHEVVVLAGEPNAKRPTEEEVNGVRVVRWPTWTPGGAYHVPRHRARLEETLRELLKEADVLHVHSIHAVLPVWAGLKARELDLKGRLVVTPYYHGTGHTPLRKTLWIPWKIYAAKLLKASDAVTTVSKLEARLVKERFGIIATPIENGVEEHVLNFNWKPKGFAMYSGRIEKYKNIHRLAHVIKILRQKGYNLELKIYGKGPYKDKLLKIIKRMDVPFTVEDFQPFGKYIETLASATLFGLLSEKESYPQSINEANTVGTPAVVAKPWGENFAERTRTLIVNLEESDKSIAEKAVRLIEEAPRQPKPRIPTWSEVTDKYTAIYAAT